MGLSCSLLYPLGYSIIIWQFVSCSQGDAALPCRTILLLQSPPSSPLVDCFGRRKTFGVHWVKVSVAAAKGGKGSSLIVLRKGSISRFGTPSLLLLLLLHFPREGENSGGGEKVPVYFSAEPNQERIVHCLEPFLKIHTEFALHVRIEKLSFLDQLLICWKSGFVTNWHQLFGRGDTQLLP